MTWAADISCAFLAGVAFGALWAWAAWTRAKALRDAQRKP